MYYVVYFTNGINQTPNYERVSDINVALALFRSFRSQGVHVTIHRLSDCEIIANY